MTDLLKCKCNWMAALHKASLIYTNSEIFFSSSYIQRPLYTTPFTPLTVSATTLAFIYCISYKSSSRTYYVPCVSLDRENVAGNKAKFLQPGKMFAHLSAHLIAVILFILLKHGFGEMLLEAPWIMSFALEVVLLRRGAFRK